MKEIVDIISSCVVLHNLMIDYEDEIPQEWYLHLLEDTDFTAADEVENVYTVNGVHEEEGSRRTQVFHNIIENFA